MELFFFEPAEYERLYNCSAYAIDQIPFEQRQHLLIGLFFCSVCIICGVLYIPCMIAIRKHMDSTCYKLMFYISITDMFGLTLNAIAGGILATTGAVFCSSPQFIYFVGAIGLGLWSCETTAEMSLAVNRCLELARPQLARFLFEGKRIYLWMLFTTLYGLYSCIFTKPALFSGIYDAFFYNPHFGYINDDELVYHNELNSIHNYLLIIVLTITYMTFALIVFFKGRQLKTVQASAGGAARVSQKNIFIQVFLISSVNAIAAAIYVLMNYVPLNRFLILLGQFCYIMTHGVPPLIYVGLNRTVRRDVYIMLVRPLSMPLPHITVPSANGLTTHASSKPANLKAAAAAAGQTTQVRPI